MVLSNLLQGDILRAAGPLPIRLRVRLGDLSPRFLAKGCVGKGYRFISRNGRILLATDTTLAALVDRIVEARLQIWHRAILEGDKPEPHGLLVCLRSRPVCSALPLYRAHLYSARESEGEFALDVGGRQWLEFQPVQEANST